MKYAMNLKQVQPHPGLESTTPCWACQANWRPAAKGLTSVLYYVAQSALNILYNWSVIARESEHNS